MITVAAVVGDDSDDDRTEAEYPATAPIAGVNDDNNGGPDPEVVQDPESDQEDDDDEDDDSSAGNSPEMAQGTNNATNVTDKIMEAQPTVDKPTAQTGIEQTMDEKYRA